MRIAYDAQADAIALRFSDDPETRCEEVVKGLILSTGGDGRLIALEVFRAHWPVSLDTFDLVVIQVRESGKDSVCPR